MRSFSLAASGSASSQETPGTPVLPPPSPSPASGGTASGRRPSTRSKTVLVKMKMMKIRGFKEKIDYFMKEFDFGDGNERKYFNKYSNMFVFGFYLEKEIVTKELLRRISSEWASKDKYWDHRPSEVIDIVIV